MMRRLLTGLVALLPVWHGYAQKIILQHSGSSVSIRGLSVVSDRVIWVSGSSGSVGRSDDGGLHWTWLQIPRYEKSDFRDIEGFSDQEAVVMGITQPAVILRTVDGGKNWTTVFTDADTAVFLDAMDFRGDQGAVVGDPLNGKIFFARTTDRGKSWKKTNPSFWNAPATGEAFFASSGSNLALLPAVGPDAQNKTVLVSGGTQSCLYMSDKRFPLLLNQGKETTGANAIAVNREDPFQVFVVGGDFKNDTLRKGNSVRIQLNPFAQILPPSPPHGYRSSVEYIDGRKMICCGTSGVDVSTDGGMHWTLISSRSFHVCRRSKNGRSVFLAGAKGSIARLQW